MPFEDIPVWFRWMAWMSPAVYVYNAVMANEMSGAVLECVESQFIPFGPNYTDEAYHRCTVVGSGNGMGIDAETFIYTTYWASQKIHVASCYLWYSGIRMLVFCCWVSC